MGWPQIKLKALAANIPYSFVGGPFGSKLTTRDYLGEGIPVIRGSNFGCGRYIDMTDFVFVSETKMRRDLLGNLARANDLVFTQRGTLGQVAMIPASADSAVYVVSQSQMKLTVDESKADRRFVYYYCSSREAVRRITNLASSSGVPHINLTILRNFEIPLPPLSKQKHIASVLSAYDDLIENNERRIALLDRAAREFYREWFVRMRFPGHESTEFIDGVPHGWEEIQLGDVVEVQKGKNITKDSARHGSVPVVAGGLTPAYYHDRSNAVGPVITISASGANAGYVNLYHEDIWASDCSYISNASVDNLFYLYLLLKSKQRQIFALQKGAAQPHVYPKDLKTLSFLAPNDVMTNRFQQLVTGNFDQVRVLNEQNTLLMRARDMLLPRLMNGEATG